MENRKTIPAGTLYATSFAGAVVSAVAVSPHLFGGGYVQALLTVAVSLAVTSCAAVPALCFSRENSSFLTLVRRSRWLRLFYFAVLTYYSFYFLSHFLIFVENTLNPATPVWLVSACVMATAVYGAGKGLHTLGRAGLFAFAMIAAGFAFIFLLLCKEADLTLLYESGEWAADVPAAALFTAGRATSLVHLLLFWPQMHGKRTAGFWVLNTGFHLLCGVLVLFLAVCLGHTAALQLFPVYTLAQLADFGAVQRLDIVFLFLWIVGIVLRLCLDLLAGASLWGKEADRRPMLLQGAVAAVAAAFTADHFPLQRWLFSSQLITGTALLSGVVVPLFLLCGERLHRKEAGAHET